ncbi:mitochondrial distribution and morphology protein 34 [Kwoniella sp. DSM 27419]
MSFVFPSWSTAFSPAFHEDAKGMLEAALNKGNKPPVIQGRIEVVELSMGEQPPTLTLLEIGDLSLDRFRGILRLGYTGDAWLEVRCRVQANPLSHNPNLLPSSTLPLSTPLLASQPLLVPMTLRLSKLHLRAILILVVSASKGITLVFKNDPLQNVDVSSTFDSVEVIRGYLQQEIEGQLREMFREDLPGIIHRLSQRWFHGTGVGGKVETPYKDNLGSSETIEEEDEEEEQDPYAEPQIFPPHVPPSQKDINLTPRRQAIVKAAQRQRRLSNPISESPTSYTTFPDIEDYDPTYGLRPEGLPTHSGYEAFGRLWEKAREGGGRGLGSLMSMPIPHEDEEGVEDRGDVSDGDWDEDEDGTRSFDMVEMDDALRSLPTPARNPRRRSLISAAGSRYEDEKQTEWETFPAVGGGMITRPRVYHSQSQIRAPSEAGGAMPSPAGTATGGSVTARASSVGGASSTIGSPQMRAFTPVTPGIRSPTLSHAGPSSLRRMVTSRSDVFLSSAAQGLNHLPRSQSFAAIPASGYKPNQRSGLSASRRQSTAAASSAARMSGSSWDNGAGTVTGTGPSRSNTMSTPASFQLPSSNSKSVAIQPKQFMPRTRLPSITGTSPGSFPPRNIGPGGITLPLNNSVSQLATLSHSAHTLSPYARGHEHIAVRSFPHLGKATGSIAGGGPAISRPGSAIGDGGVVKAKRKRIYNLGGGKKNKEEATFDPDAKAQLSRLDDSPYSDEVDDDFRGSADGAHGHVHAWRPTAIAHTLGSAAQSMGIGVGVGVGGGGGGGTARPNLKRNPDSRTSYGFPPAFS